MMTQGSPQWQAVLVGISAAFVLWELWAGWRRGVVRGAVHFFAFVLSGVVGFGAGQVAAAVVGKILPGFGLIAGLLVGSVLTLLVLFLSLLLGALLFKRTAQQPSPLLRVLFGLGGSFFGALTALFILWGGISIIRAMGAVADTAAPAVQMAAATGMSAPPAAGVVEGVIKLRDSLELGPVGNAVNAVDVVPASAYEMITRVGRLSTDQDAMARLLDDPALQEILKNPKMAALLNDPQVARDAQNRDILALIRNPKLLEAVTDPELSKLLLKVDLQKALDYAMPPAQSSPTPSR